MALVTQTDIEARIGALSTEQAARVAALIADAEGEVRDFTGQQIDQATDDTVVLNITGARLILPQRPVTAVTAVELKDGASWLTVTGWAWDGRDGVDLAGATWSGSAVHDTQTYRVTYTHGYPPGSIPNAVVRTICGMVARTLTAPSLVEGLTSETIGQYSYQLQQGQGAAGTAVALNQRDEARLRRAGFRRSNSSVFVRAR